MANGVSSARPDRRPIAYDVFTPRAQKAHVISLRKANKREVERYEAQA